MKKPDQARITSFMSRFHRPEQKQMGGWKGLQFNGIQLPARKRKRNNATTTLHCHVLETPHSSSSQTPQPVAQLLHPPPPNTHPRPRNLPHRIHLPPPNRHPRPHNVHARAHLPELPRRHPRPQAQPDRHADDDPGNRPAREPVLPRHPDRPAPPEVLRLPLNLPVPLLPLEVVVAFRRLLGGFPFLLGPFLLLWWFLLPLLLLLFLLLLLCLGL